MPYAVQHKSQDVCYVRYVKNKRHRGKLLLRLLSLMMAVLGLFIFSFGMVRTSTYTTSLTLAFIIFALVALWNGLWLVEVGADTFDHSSEFEIELNRALGIIFVRNKSHPHREPTTYSFGTFKGFGFHRTPYGRKSIALFQAELYFKMEPIRGMRRKIPIRNRTYVVAPENAQDIVDEIDEWLGLAETDMVDKSTPNEPESIMRDFRDMEESGDKNAL